MAAIRRRNHISGTPDIPRCHKRYVGRPCATHLLSYC
ncbi:hypothetical protein LINPERPRIM_LOCUS24332 [Linum perenne]